MVWRKYAISSHFFDRFRSGTNTNTVTTGNSRVLAIMTSRPHQLNDAMLQQYGPLIGGVDLRMALGFRTATTFQRAMREKTLSVPVFDVPGRRGKFALTVDVAAWLSTVSGSGRQPGGPEPTATEDCVGKSRVNNARGEAEM